MIKRISTTVVVKDKSQGDKVQFEPMTALGTVPGMLRQTMTSIILMTHNHDASRELKPPDWRGKGWFPPKGGGQSRAWLAKPLWNSLSRGARKSSLLFSHWGRWVFSRPWRKFGGIKMENNTLVNEILFEAWFFTYYGKPQDGLLIR